MVRVVVVSNRLPVTIYPDREAPSDIKSSSGGLVSALRSVADRYEELVWIGWPGCAVPEDKEKEEYWAKRIAFEMPSMKLVPVWLSEHDVEDFYTGFSNSSLWPLLHWMTPYARFKKSWAECYRKVNEQFANIILSVVGQDDLIFVQDYHLFLVPKLLRDKERLQQERIRLEESVQPVVQRPSHLPPPIGDSEGASVPRMAMKRPSDLPDEHEETLHVNSAPEIRMEDDSSSIPQESAESGVRKVHTVAEMFEPLSRAFSTGAAVPSMDRFKSMKDEAPPPPPGREKADSSPGNGGSRRWLKIAFFLHTPFPAYEVLAVLPSCMSEDILHGALGADLVGFHTYSYLRHFRSCVVRLCGYTPDLDIVDHDGQQTHLGVFPIGADWQGITTAMAGEEFAKHLGDYTAQFQGKSLVLSVERLDYSKGLPEKLAAIERYLQKHVKPHAEDEEEEAQEEEESHVERLEAVRKRLEARMSQSDGRPAGKAGQWSRMGAAIKKVVGRPFVGRASEEIQNSPLDHRKTVFLFIAVPSRQEVKEYKQIEEEVHRIIGKINGSYSTPTHTPIVYIHRPIPIEELTALYARADLCLVTPLIDGMNLVAKEFVAAKDPSIPNVVPGTLVLSELAGAAQELFDAMIVNPYDEDEVADMIFVGLELSRGEALEESARWQLTQGMRQNVEQNDAVNWATTLLAKLQETAGTEVTQPIATAVEHLGDLHAADFFAGRVGMKALFLDYDGTLREFEKKPEDAVPSDQVHHLLALLDARTDLMVFIISGRSKEFLSEHFERYKRFTLIAESGYEQRLPINADRQPREDDWEPLLTPESMNWLEKVEPIMELYHKCTPGSTIEVKHSSIVFHYRDCEEEYGEFKAKELVHQLTQSLGNLFCQIGHGNKIVEVASLEIKKGFALRNACRKHEQESGIPFAEVLCIGDDRTDESMFQEATPGTLTVKVGEGNTHANFFLRDPEDVRRFLHLIVDQSVPSKSPSADRTEESPSSPPPHRRFESTVEPVEDSSNKSKESKDGNERFVSMEIQRPEREPSDKQLQMARDSFPDDLLSSLPEQEE